MQGQIKSETRSAQPVYAGIDVCKDRLDVYIHPIGQHLCVANDPGGIKRLRGDLARHAVDLVVVEATGKYHRLVQRSLSQSGIAVAVVNPLRSRLFAEVLGSRAKTDRVDARMLAVLGAAVELQATPPAPEVIEALQELVHARNAATADHTAMSNRLKTSQVAFLRREITDLLDSLKAHIDRLDGQISQMIANDPALVRRYDILVSIPGVGPVVAAVLIADMPELGQLNRHTAACLAGVAPFADDSGDCQGIRHIKGGRAHPRRALYWAALSATRHNRDLAEFYNRLRDNGKKPKVALTAVMRKLIILANTLINENRPWTPARP